MSETNSAGNLFKAGKLTEALEAANAEVRRSPAELGPRLLLAELLLFAGNLERADVILDAASQIDPEAILVVSEFRQLLRGEMARRQFRRDGRIPEFLGAPTPALAEILGAHVSLRAGDPSAAAAHVAAAEELRPRVAGHSGDAKFDDFRDACDLHAGYFEILTTTGKYFWIPTERVETAEFHPPKRARDLYWRRVTMSVQGGPDGEVYMPALYGTDDPDLEPALRLGRATDWLEKDGLVQGVGQRIFLAGDEAAGIQTLAELEFAN